VRKIIILALVYAGLGACSARAVDINVTSQLIQSSDFNSNYFLQIHPPGAIIAPVSTLRVNSLARTPTMRFAATTDLSYRSYFGPGLDEFRVNDALDKGARAELEKTDKLTTYNFAASVRQAQASPLQLAQIGVSSIAGFVNTAVVQGGLRHELTLRDTLDWQNSYTSTTFTAPGSIPFTDFSSKGIWTRKLTPTIALVPSVQFEQLNYEGPAKAEVMLWRLMMGVRFEPSVRLSFYGEAGALLATARQNANVNVPVSNVVPSILLPSGPDVASLPAFQPAIFLPGAPIAQSGSSSAADWLANLRVTYRFDPTTTLTWVAAQTVAPDSFGNIFRTDSVGLLLQRQINYSAYVSLAADASRFTSIGTVSNFYTAAATYGYRFTREWDASLTYTFRQREASTFGKANSHSILVFVRRDVTIIP
jgi:hypothetical protein